MIVGDPLPHRPIGDLAEKSDHEDDRSTERDCNAKISLQIQDRKINFLPEGSTSIIELRFIQAHSRFIQFTEHAQSYQHSRQQEERVDTEEPRQQEHREDIFIAVEHRGGVDGWRVPNIDAKRVAEDNPNYRQGSQAVNEKHFFR